MAITYVGVSTETIVSNANITLTEPASVQQNDVLLAIIAHRSTVGYQAPSGWTKLLDQSIGDTSTTCSSAEGSGELFWIVRGSSAPTLTFTKESGTGDVAQGRIIAFRGCDTTTPVRNSTSTTIAAASTTVVTATALSHNNGDAVVGAWCGACDTTWSSERINGAPTSLTEVADSLTTTGADTSLAIAYTILSSGISSQTTQATAAASGRHVVLVVTLKPPPVFQISNAEDEAFWPNERGVIITGELFGSTQGTSIVVIGDSATYASANKQTQTAIRSWSDTSIQFDINLGSLGQGTRYFYVVKDPTGTPVISNAWQVQISDPQDTGWQSPSVASNTTGSGSIAWTASGTVLQTSNDTYATAAVTSGNATNYLNGNTWAFSTVIPSDAYTLNGLEIQIERKTDQADSVITQNVFFYNSTVQSDTLWGANYWETSDTYESWGSSSDPLGMSVAKLRASGLWLLMQCGNEGGVTANCSVDHYRVKAYYSRASTTLAISSIKYGPIFHGQVNVDVIGTYFEDKQLDTLLRIGDGATYATCNKVTQTVSSWTDTVLRIGTLNLTGLSGNSLYFFVVKNPGLGNEQIVSYGPVTRVPLPASPDGTTQLYLNTYSDATTGWTYQLNGGSQTLGNNVSTNRLWNWETTAPPTTGVGPTAPYEGGGYVYVESGSATAGDVFTMTRSSLDFSTNIYWLQFKWLKRGSANASLYVDFSDNSFSTYSTFTVFENTTDTLTSGEAIWRDCFIPCDNYFTSGTVQYRFRVILNAISFSDVAIDTVLHTYDARPQVLSITNADDEDFLDNELAVRISGLLFGATQGTSIVVLGSSATYSSATKVTQTKIRSWSDTAIYFDVMQGALSDGTLYLYVVKDPGGAGEEITPAYAVSVYKKKDTGWLPPTAIQGYGYNTNWTDATVANLSSDDGTEAYLAADQVASNSQMFLQFGGIPGAIPDGVCITNMIHRFKLRLSSDTAPAYGRIGLQPTYCIGDFTADPVFYWYPPPQSCTSPRALKANETAVLYTGDPITHEGYGWLPMSMLKPGTNVWWNIVLRPDWYTFPSTPFTAGTLYMNYAHMKVSWEACSESYITKVLAGGYLVNGSSVSIQGSGFGATQLDSALLLSNENGTVTILQTPTVWSNTGITFTLNVGALNTAEHVVLYFVRSYGKSYEYRSNPFKLKLADLSRVLATYSYPLNDYTSASDVAVWEYYTENTGVHTLGNNTSTADYWNWETTVTPTAGTGPSAPQEGAGYVYLEPGTYGSSGYMKNLVGLDISLYEVYVSFWYNKCGNFDGVESYFFVEPNVSWDYPEIHKFGWSHFGIDVPYNGTDVWRRVVVKLSDFYSGPTSSELLSSVQWGIYSQSYNNQSDFGLDSFTVYVCAKRDAELLASGMVQAHVLSGDMAVDSLSVTM